jgi:hypothetical protein
MRPSSKAGAKLDKLPEDLINHNIAKALRNTLDG